MKSMDHGKPGLAILIANKASKGKPSEDYDEGALDAMKAFMAAIKDDDAEAALDEYKNLMSLCEGAEEED